MTAPTVCRRRTRQGVPVQRTAPAPIVDEEPLPAAVRDLLDKAEQWPEFEAYFLSEASKILGRPVSR